MNFQSLTTFVSTFNGIDQLLQLVAWRHWPLDSECGHRVCLTLSSTISFTADRHVELTVGCCVLIEAVREAQSQNKELSRQVQELTTIRVQLQNERDGLSAELSDTKDALKDAMTRLEASNAALTQLRSDMEHRLREKDDEIDNIRWVINSHDS